MSDKPKSSSFVKFKNPISQQTSNQNETNKASSSAASLINIPGCKTSLHNNQLLTSIGIPSIDYFIGGGLPVGSVCLIGEDTFNYYADIICRCFIAEGVLNKHSIYIASPFAESTNLLHRIPNVSSKDENEQEDKDKANLNTQLRIAWRYGDSSSLLSTNTVKSTETHNYFLLNKYMNLNESNDVKLFQFNLNTNNFYKNLANEINSVIDARFNVTKLKQFTNIVRIVINAVGSSFWNDKTYENDDDGNNSVKLFQFLLYLRQILRHSLGVCLITVQNDLLNNVNFVSKLQHLSDYVFVIDDNESTKSRLDKTQYEGLFRISKLPRLNTLNSYLPETLDIAFYVKRKRFIVEILHLPPDITEETNEKKGRTNTSSSASTLACASVGPSKLDF